MKQMLEIIENILSNVLTAFYQPFWFSLIAAILLMFLYLYCKERKMKEAVQIWIYNFKSSSTFRRLFCLAFLVMMILMRTLLNRSMWLNPVSNIMGNWTLHNKNGELTTEPLENILLMMPYTALLLWALKDRLLNKITFRGTMWIGIKFAFLTSLCIEFLQLFLRLGTFQLSDIAYNTLGGLLGGLTYYIGYKVKENHKGH